VTGQQHSPHPGDEPPPDPNPVATALANTYDPHGAAAGWERVAEYRRVREYAAENPEQGSAAVASVLDRPERAHPGLGRGREAARPGPRYRGRRATGLAHP
jgi:hypothetical protein